MCHFHFSFPSGPVRGHSPQNSRVSVQNAALAVAEGLVGLGKKNFHSNLPLLPLRQDLIWFLRDLEWETSGLLKFICFGPFGFEEKLLCLSSNLPSGFCVCFLKRVQFRRVGMSRGFICV